MKINLMNYSWNQVDDYFVICYIPKEISFVVNDVGREIWNTVCCKRGSVEIDELVEVISKNIGFLILRL